MNEESSNCLIIDLGSWSCKAGLSSEDNPQIIMPSYVGKDKSIDKKIKKYGKEALIPNPELIAEPLIENSKIKNWENLEKYLDNLINNELDIKISERPTLTSYYANTNKYTKERTAQLFFENFNVPYYYAASNAILSLYSSGRINGIVIDLGHGKTSIVPIHEGSPLNFAQNFVNFGGQDLSGYLIKEFNLDLLSAHKIKEKYGRISLDFQTEQKNLLYPKEMIIEDEESVIKHETEFILPDNRKIEFKDRMIKLGESLFNPSLIGKKDCGLHDLVYNSLQKVEFDTRKELIGNIIVGGGSTNFSNFNDRLMKEMFLLNPSNVKIKCYNLNERKNAVWFGGAIVSYLGTFQPMWITRNEYDECGPSVINRKCI